MLPKRPVSFAKVAIFVSAALLSAGLAYGLQPKYHDSSNAITVLTTAFSILAGFLVAVMALVADERALRGANWRQDVVYLELIKRDIGRHRRMFYLYLIVLSLAFIASIASSLPYNIQTWMERTTLFLAFLAMFWSFRLPGYLTRRHLDNLDQLIRARRDAQTK